MRPKRAVKNGMTLEEWIEFKNTVPEVTLYHYTNGGEITLHFERWVSGFRSRT